MATITAAAPPLPRVRPLRYEPETEAVPVQLALVAAPPQPRAPLPRPPVPQRTIEDELVRRRAQQALRLTLEVLDGRRPCGQLGGLVEPAVRRYVAAAAAHRAAGRPAPSARLRSLRLDQPRPGVAEVAAVCELGGRIRAIAARFELLDGPAARFELRDGPVAGWRCTALRLG